MQIGPDCIPCILKVVISAIRTHDAGEKAEKELLARALDLPAFRGRAWEKTPPEVIEAVLTAVFEITGVPDPFREIKVRQNEQALAVLPWLRTEVARAARPLQMAVRAAVVGNSIDLMTNPEGTLDVAQIVRDRLARPLPEEALEELERRLRSSRRIVYFGDNCGEVVFDLVLVEQLREEAAAEVVFVVRNGPTLNDVTLREAEEVGLNSVCRVVPNGIGGRLPGTALSRCSPEIRRYVAEADLVLSKGGGNFDSFDEEPTGRPTAFLVQTKCRAYQKRFGTELEYPVLQLSWC